MSGAPLSLSAPPGYWPGDNAAEERPVRRWRVLHACDAVQPTATVVEAEIQAGMRPSVLTPTGWYRPGNAEFKPATGLSLIHEWQQVRRWRNRFVSEIVDHWAEVLHAHCFAAAMAGLRGNSPLVYDLLSPIGAGIMPRPGAWLLRSLRVAEQFLLSRADAVVVHSHVMWDDAVRRGTRTEELFLVPEPVELPEIEVPPARAGITLFAPDVLAGNAKDVSVPSLQVVLRAFAAIASEVENVQLIIEGHPSIAAKITKEAQKRGVAGRVSVMAPADRHRAMAAAHIVIAGTPRDADPNATATWAMAHGRALLAADVPQNREVTPQGRGCLWYRAGDDRDLAARAAFLARNRDFRAALGLSGRDHLHSTCGPVAVARKYDDVYRHAYQRRRDSNMDSLHQLRAVRVSP